MKCGSAKDTLGMYAVTKRMGIQHITIKVRAGFIVSFIGAPPTLPLKYNTGAAGGVIHPSAVLTPIIAA